MNATHRYHNTTPRVENIVSDEIHKIELICKKKNILALFGAQSFFQKCIKGMDKIQIYNEQGIRTCLKEYMEDVFHSLQGPDYPNIYKIIESIERNQVRSYDIHVIESMLSSYFYEYKIKDIWTHMIHITIEDHDYFMRFLIAISSKYRFQYHTIELIAIRFFEFMENEKSRYNPSQRIRLPIHLMDDLFEYQPVFDYFYETQHEIQHFTSHIIIDDEEECKIETESMDAIHSQVCISPVERCVAPSPQMMFIQQNYSTLTTQRNEFIPLQMEQIETQRVEVSKYIQDSIKLISLVCNNADVYHKIESQLLRIQQESYDRFENISIVKQHVNHFLKTYLQ
jgi:hypothetical protein